MSELRQLMRDGRLWRGRQAALPGPAVAAPGVPSGHPALDRDLPFGDRITSEFCVRV